MEDKINIAEILRDMPKGTKLYSPIFGDTVLEYVDSDDKYPIIVTLSNGSSENFSPHGIYFAEFEDAEPVLYPSSKMRCWSKFFKRGDVLFDDDMETTVIFEGWTDEDYTEFNTTINRYKISDAWNKGDICLTPLFTKATDEERAKFIAAAEKHYGGKYNPETLQVEPVKVSKPMCSFKPFQKVLVREDKYDAWKADFFSNYDESNEYAPYICVSDLYKFCIPYEGNQHLLGATNNPK